jgi:hypothetical protein
MSKDTDNWNLHTPRPEKMEGYEYHECKELLEAQGIESPPELWQSLKSKDGWILTLYGRGRENTPVEFCPYCGKKLE